VREAEPPETAHDRDEAAAAEEGEITWQADVVEAVVQRAAHQPREDAERHVELEELVLLVRRDGELAGATAQVSDHPRRHRDQHLRSL